MYVRLAFAVAAHPSTRSGQRLEPEILLVDESLSRASRRMLAVGDAQFQKKYLGNTGAMTKERRTLNVRYEGTDRV
jgi:ABC-type polysaccharide/polyol phosphate transport system ATPase subunit